MEPHGDPSPDEPGTDVPAPTPQPLGGVFHTYLGYDAVKFGSAHPADPGAAAKGAFEHLMAAGNMRRFTDEELADAIRIDPSQIQGLGPSIDALIELLEQRKAKILATHDPLPAAAEAARAFREADVLHQELGLERLEVDLGHRGDQPLHVRAEGGFDGLDGALEFRGVVAGALEGAGEVGLALGGGGRLVGRDRRRRAHGGLGRGGVLKREEKEREDHVGNIGGVGSCAFRSQHRQDGRAYVLKPRSENVGGRQCRPVLRDEGR
jgi:hypothetical protein